MNVDEKPLTTDDGRGYGERMSKTLVAGLSIQDYRARLDEPASVTMSKLGVKDGHSFLTPAEARAVAKELIAAADRAEGKS